MTRLTVTGLCKSYAEAGRPALEGLDLTVESGTLTALLGPSGCGKTTAMKLVAGLLRPDAGDVQLDGRSIRDTPPERRGVAMVFQNPLLFPHLTVAGNLGFGLRMRGMAADRIALRVGEMLEQVQLSGLGNRRPVELSGGQQQRAALARALILRPEVLLLDEPLSNLDPSLRDGMRALIRALQRETGITTLIVTHDQTEAVAIADRIALMLDGRVVQHDPPETFFRRPASLAVARFFGGANFLPGRVEAGRFHASIGPFPLSEPVADGPAVLTIRPESLVIGHNADGHTAIVREIRFQGSQTRLVLDIAGWQAEALLPPDQVRDLSIGQTLTVSLPPGALWVLPDDPARDRAGLASLARSAGSVAQSVN